MSSVLQPCLAMRATSMINLPSEIVYAICQELDEGSWPTSRLSPLWSLALTCKSMHEHAQQILWRRVKVRFDTSNVHDDDILHRLRCLVQDTHRPQFRFVRTINITLPYYSMVSRSDFCTDVDKAVALLLQLAREVKHITLDLSLIDHPLEMLQRTFTHLFKNLDNLESLSLAGYICGSEDIPIQRNSMQSLHLEVIGNRLPFRFDNNQSLRRLRLGIDCRDEELPLHSALQFPPQLWKTLECFVLELYGWHVYARSVKDTIAASIQTIECTNLHDLGLFLHTEDDDQESLLSVILQASPNVTRLALVMPALPTIQQIYDIAAGNSRLTELTLCAYLSCGRWQWSGSASDYGRAFSLFPHLRKLAINHDDLAIFPNMTEEAESCGEFAMTCSREGALLRRQFVEAVVALATSIAEVAICPFEQENSRMKVIRLGGETVSVDFVEESNKFFWELL